MFRGHYLLFHTSTVVTRTPVWDTSSNNNYTIPVTQLKAVDIKKLRDSYFLERI